jgi:hypothetical protein
VRKESQNQEDEFDRIHKLFQRGRYWPIYRNFDTQAGSRVWSNRFEKTKLPLLIEFTQKHPISGRQLNPNVLELSYEHFLTCPKGDVESDGEENRVVKWDDLPTVDPKIVNRKIIVKMRKDEQERLAEKRRQKQGRQLRA